MTILKFRAWDKTHKKLGLIDADILNGELGSVKIFDDDDDDWQTVDRFILMQSTGLFDKNGQEIFEGDVVICYDEQDEYGPYPCQIFFCEYNLAWSLKELHTEDKYTMSEYGWDEIEVVGNIYENPEFMGAENE